MLQFIAVAAVVGGLYFGVHEVKKGVKKVGHEIGCFATHLHKCPKK